MASRKSKPRTSEISASTANEQQAVDMSGYIEMNGQRLELVRHPTDFSVLAPANALSDYSEQFAARQLSAQITRAQVKAPAERDRMMTEVRKASVAHHIYNVKDTDEELVIDDKIILNLRHESPQELEAVIGEFNLVPAGRMGAAYVLQVTEATGMNPLKAANVIAQRSEVLSCTPQVLVDIQMHQTSLTDSHRLFRRQWYLTADLMTSPDLSPTAGIRAPEAWRITTGSPDIVVAVIDDGFDLEHPAFRNKRIHPDRRDFAVALQDNDPQPGQQDYHGTCVASIATGAMGNNGMIGVAPGCTFLPIRIGFSMAAPVDILDVFRYASARADVVNCSFGTSPTSFDPFPPPFRAALTELARTGGRRGKGLVMVFSAANDDAPTLLSAADNRNGVHFVRGGQIARIPANRAVFSGYPLTPGVIVVGAMSSLKRKSGYSCWGPHLTVTAPSNNMHYITSFIDRGVNDAVRDRFVANYRGLGQVAATNRPGNGAPFSALPDDPTTLGLAENFYTQSFGGTSGAAPVVTGVVALMLSVNPNLTAEQVRQILMSTADRDLDPTLDLANDPNVQGLSGAFVNGRSLFFGAGKVNALRAVERAQALVEPIAPSIVAGMPGLALSNATPGHDCVTCVTPASSSSLLFEAGNLLTPSAQPAVTPNQCLLWRLGTFRTKVLLAVARWAHEPPTSILPSNTLGELSKGTPWNEGQQVRLVQAVNDPALDVFAPFTGTKMVPPSQLLPASTTVAQWENVVWQSQFPRTPCFFLIGS